MVIGVVKVHSGKIVKTFTTTKAAWNWRKKQYANNPKSARMAIVNRGGFVFKKPRRKPRPQGFGFSVPSQFRMRI